MNRNGHRAHRHERAVERTDAHREECERLREGNPRSTRPAADAALLGSFDMAKNWGRAREKEAWEKTKQWGLTRRILAGRGAPAADAALMRRFHMAKIRGNQREKIEERNRCRADNEEMENSPCRSSRESSGRRSRRRSHAEGGDTRWKPGGAGGAEP